MLRGPSLIPFNGGGVWVALDFWGKQEISNPENISGLRSALAHGKEDIIFKTLFIP